MGCILPHGCNTSGLRLIHLDLGISHNASKYYVFFDVINLIFRGVQALDGGGAHGRKN